MESTKFDMLDDGDDSSVAAIARARVNKVRAKAQAE
jgi:hypothetical protein